MPVIRNSELIRRFTKYFKLKVNDFLDSEAGRLIVPVVNLPVPPNIVQISDVILNNSDKTITVPSGKQWKILYGFINFISTAEVGSRRISVNFLDENSNILFQVRALNTQTASLTETYTLGQFEDVTEPEIGSHYLSIPVNSILDENFIVRVFDAAAIAAVADDMTIRLIVEEIEVTGE